AQSENLGPPEEASEQPHQPQRREPLPPSLENGIDESESEVWGNPPWEPEPPTQPDDLSPLPVQDPVPEPPPPEQDDRAASSEPPIDSRKTLAPIGLRRITRGTRWLDVSTTLGLRIAQEGGYAYLPLWGGRA